MQTLAGIDGEAGTPVFTGGRDRRACFLADRPGNVLVELTELAANRSLCTSIDLPMMLGTDPRTKRTE
jgi:hypothetical protein